MVFYSITDGIELRAMNDHTVEGVVPHPVVGEEYEPWREHHQAHQVEVRLVVADNDGRLFKCLAHFVLQIKLDARYTVNDKIGHTL